MTEEQHLAAEAIFWCLATLGIGVVADLIWSIP